MGASRPGAPAVTHIFIKSLTKFYEFAYFVLRTPQTARFDCAASIDNRRSQRQRAIMLICDVVFKTFGLAEKKMQSNQKQRRIHAGTSWQDLKKAQ
jgi:hypothetical protein